MSHSHSQILALPVIPPTASARIQSMKEHFEQTGECALCQIKQEDLLIHTSNHFKSIVPYAAMFPFEIWIIPCHHSPHFDDLDSDMVTHSFWPSLSSCIETDDFQNSVFFYLVVETMLINV